MINLPAEKKQIQFSRLLQENQLIKINFFQKLFKRKQ